MLFPVFRPQRVSMCKMEATSSAGTPVAALGGREGRRVLDRAGARLGDAAAPQHPPVERAALGAGRSRRRARRTRGYAGPRMRARPGRGRRRRPRAAPRASSSPSPGRCSTRRSAAAERARARRWVQAEAAARLPPPEAERSQGHTQGRPRRPWRASAACFARPSVPLYAPPRPLESPLDRAPIGSKPTELAWETLRGCLLYHGW